MAICNSSANILFKKSLRIINTVIKNDDTNLILWRPQINGIDACYSLCSTLRSTSWKMHNNYIFLTKGVTFFLQFSDDAISSNFLNNLNLEIILSLNFPLHFILSLAFQFSVNLIDIF